MTPGHFQIHICDVLSGKNGIHSHIPKKNYHCIACSSPNESSHLSLHASYRSLPARGPLIDSRDCVNSLHVHWPIKTPRPSCANQDAWAVVTLKLPEGEFYSHVWTGTPPRNIAMKAALTLIHYALFYLNNMPLAVMILGIEAWLWTVCRTSRFFKYELNFYSKMHLWWPSFNFPGS